jgi:hypothetical protein
MIKLVAFLTAASAIFVIAPTAQTTYSRILGLYQGQFAADFLPMLAFLLLLNVLLPFFKLIVSFGLYGFRHWARKFGVAVIGCEALLRLIVLAKFLYANLSVAAGLAESNMVVAINAAPSSAIFLVDLFCLFKLTRGKSKLLDVELTPGARHRSL